MKLTSTLKAIITIPGGFRFRAPGQALCSVLALFGLGLVWSTALADDIVWTNTASGNWNAVTNWSPNSARRQRHRLDNKQRHLYRHRECGRYYQRLGAGRRQRHADPQPSHLHPHAERTGQQASSQGVYTLTSGTLTGTGSLSLAGPFNWNGGTLGSTTVNPAVTANGGLTLGSRLKNLLRYPGQQRPRHLDRGHGNLLRHRPVQQYSPRHAGLFG